jgi:hypothetical protein
VSTEYSLHQAILGFFRAVLPSTWLVVHIPGNPRSKVAGAALKQMGATAGMPDLMIVGEGWVGFAEIKAPKGRLSSEQKRIHERLQDIGVPIRVLRSIEDARQFVAEHALPSREIAGRPGRTHDLNALRNSRE